MEPLAPSPPTPTRPRWLFWVFLFAAVGWSFILGANLHRWFAYKTTCSHIDPAQDPVAFVISLCNFPPPDDHILALQVFIILANAGLAWWEWRRRRAHRRSAS